MLELYSWQKEEKKNEKKETYDFRLRKMVVDINKDALQTMRGAWEVIVDVLKEQLTVDDKDMVFTDD